MSAGAKSAATCEGASASTPLSVMAAICALLSAASCALVKLATSLSMAVIVAGAKPETAFDEIACSCVADSD